MKQQCIPPGSPGFVGSRVVGSSVYQFEIAQLALDIFKGTLISTRSDWKASPLIVSTYSCIEIEWTLVGFHRCARIDFDFRTS